MTVFQNLNKVKRQWEMISRVLMKTTETVRARGLMYKSVAQSVMMYSSDSWVVMGAMLKVLEGFQHWASRQITGMIAKHVPDE